MGESLQQLHGYYFEDLEVGMSDSYSKTVTDEDITKFADVTGDTNPVHLNEAFAAASVFKQRIAHGMLSAGYISTVIGTKLPGPGCIYVSQNLKFKAPVKIGDTVVTKCTITKLIDKLKFIEMETICYVNDKPVLTGEATIMVPVKAG